MKETRSIKTSEIRAVKSDDGKQYLEGYAARYNVLSGDLGWGMRERLLPEAFTRAIIEKQDVAHLVNHDPSQILGRTLAGTTVLTEDDKGLRFRTLINGNDPAAVAFASRVERGDINQCSFGFVARIATWSVEPDPDNPDCQLDIREVKDLDLFDISTVTYPAYPQTSTALNAIRVDFSRGTSTGRDKALPVGLQLRAHASFIRDAEDSDPEELCECNCLACQDGECEDCLDPDCADENCRCEMSLRARRSEEKKTKKVDGEDLTADCFIIVGNPDDPKTWKLPWKFSSLDKTVTHLRNALARFNQMKSVSEEAKKTAWDKLLALCKAHNIDVSSDENKSIRERLTAEQFADLTFDQEVFARVRRSRMLEIESTL